MPPYIWHICWYMLRLHWHITTDLLDKNFLKSFKKDNNDMFRDKESLSYTLTNHWVYTHTLARASFFPWVRRALYTHTGNLKKTVKIYPNPNLIPLRQRNLKTQLQTKGIWKHRYFVFRWTENDLKTELLVWFSWQTFPPSRIQKDRGDCCVFTVCTGTKHLSGMKELSKN